MTMLLRSTVTSRTTVTSRRRTSTSETTTLLGLLSWGLLLSSVLLSQTSLRGVEAFVYPLPGSTAAQRFESVNEYRARENITYRYHPQHLNPEMCKYLTEAECRRDDAFAGRARSENRQQQRLLRQEQQQGQQQHPNRALKSPSVSDDELNLLVLLVRFSDHTTRILPTKEQIQDLCDGSGGGDNNMKRYYKQQSYDRYNINCQVMDWLTTDNTELAYAAGRSMLVGSVEAQKFFHPVLSQLDQTNAVDWPRFASSDGKLHNVLVFHSGYAAEGGGTDCSNQRQAVDRIYSQGHPGADRWDSWEDSTNTYYVGGFAIASALRGTCNERLAEMNVMTHEVLHTFGAPDLYDMTLRSQGLIGGIGAYDLMSLPYGQGGRRNLAGSVGPWTKMEIGWLQPKVIDGDGVYTIAASQLEEDVYVIYKAFPADEYLIIENRQKLEFDANLWQGGLLIYKIDDTKPVMEQRGYPGQSGWPENNNHYQVAVLQADGQYHLEQGDNVGDAGDVWVGGSSGQVLGPRPSGDASTFPNTESYQSTIYQTGITITPLSTTGTTMTFEVSGLGVASSSGSSAENGNGGGDGSHNNGNNGDNSPSSSNEEGGDGDNFNAAASSSSGAAGSVTFGWLSSLAAVLLVLVPGLAL